MHSNKSLTKVAKEHVIREWREVADEEIHAVPEEQRREVEDY